MHQIAPRNTWGTLSAASVNKTAASNRTKGRRFLTGDAVIFAEAMDSGDCSDTDTEGIHGKLP
jgi:hypothetical protein